MSPPTSALTLDSAWLNVIDETAREVLRTADRTGPALAAEVAWLSEGYTRDRGAIDRASRAWAARMRFFLPRDLPKIQGPLGELAWSGRAPSNPVWRVLDLGAGLGTTSLGIAELARRAGAEKLEVVAVERDRRALDVFAALSRAAEAAELIVPIRLQPNVSDLESLGSFDDRFDLVVIGLALNELHATLEPCDRLDAHERFLRRCLELVAPGGSLIVLEPASKERARALQTLRGRLVDELFAPCLHEAQCPLLRRERDWCHSQLPFVLPDSLAATARGAGLRTERLTYAYLTLRPDGARLHRDPRALRIVGGPIASKGKTEWDGCGERGLVRLRLLDRERQPHHEALSEAARGSLIALGEPPEPPALRIRPDVSCERVL